MYIFSWEDDFFLCLFHNYCSAVRMTGRWKTTEQRWNRLKPPSSVLHKQQEKHVTLSVSPHLYMSTHFSTVLDYYFFLFRLVDLLFITFLFHIWCIYMDFCNLQSNFMPSPIYTVIIYNKCLVCMCIHTLNSQQWTHI